MVTEEELKNMSPAEIEELRKSNCPFCKIIKGEIPSNKVYEDDKIIAIMDINPSKKGHVIIVPKEHYPILPLVPPEIFKHMFDKTKVISAAIKKTVLAKGVSIFIANGALAGQQSPHFLFHIIPRDNENDELKMFKPDLKDLSNEQNQILASLKNNFNIMMQNHMKRENISFNGKQTDNTTSDIQNLSQEEKTKLIQKKQEQIARVLQENPDVRKLLIEDLEEFKNLISQNQEVKQVFEGIDLQQLSNSMKTLQETNKELFDQQFPPETKEKPPSPDSQTADSQTTDQGSPKASEDSSARRPEVFLGEDPYKQKEIVFDYFKEKPKAKQLLMEDLETFKKLLASREDVQKIFENVNLDKLSEKLIEAEKYNEGEENE